MTGTGTSDDEVAGTDRGARRTGRWVIVVAAAAVLAVVAVIAFSVGRLSTLGDQPPANASAEAGFARDMQVHHQQGVELAMIIRDGTDDEAVRLLAYDIATAQAQQSGQMYGWLAEWGLPQAGPEPSMTWMTRPADGGAHDGHGSGEAAHEPGEPMPGLATSEQIAELRTLEGVEAEREFLELMIEHHRGAVEMAEAVLARSAYPVVVSLAESIVRSQEAEIRLMQDMLDERS
ncbi:DUF305 domain-containing protein [Agromyces arachidis]|uniref:DUF305 domain-containing protein n=1 Tax=Agromyces arachidis TaxID=766966 RepID=UPI0040567840